jgi:hypothetical protein
MWVTDSGVRRQPARGIVDGMNVRDSRVHNYPPRWNVAPSQELLRMWPISTRVNKPENDDPSIIEPIEPATDAA